MLGEKNYLHNIHGHGHDTHGTTVQNDPSKS